MSEIHIVAADHPSLDDQVEHFITALRDERRRFGPGARANPKPFPSLLHELRRRGGFRLAAMSFGQVVGLVRVDGSGGVHVAVAESHRGDGVGTALLTAAVGRAGQLHYGRLVLRSSRRSRAVRRLGDRLGCTTVDLGVGRLDIILPVPVDTTTASA